MAEHLRQYTVPQFGVVTARQAEACGFSAREVEELCRKADWTRVRHGVYLPATAPDPQDDPSGRHLLEVAAALLAVDADDAVVAHESAAVAWGLELLNTPDLSVAVLARPPGAKTRIYTGLRIRPAPLPPGHVTRSPRGMPVTTPARTIVDMARRLPLADVLVMTDPALRSGLVTRADLDRMVLDCAGWPGIRQAARHLAMADGRAGSVAESLARAIFYELGLPTPDLQVPFRGADGRLAYVDFYFAAYRLVIEVDGRKKYASPEDIWREKRREDGIRESDVEVLRLSWGDLTGDREILRGRIKAAIARATRRRAS